MMPTKPQAPARNVLMAEVVAVIDQERARPPRGAAAFGLLLLYGATCALAVCFLWLIFGHHLSSSPKQHDRVVGHVQDHRWR